MLGAIGQSVRRPRLEEARPKWCLKLAPLAQVRGNVGIRIARWDGSYNSPD